MRNTNNKKAPKTPSPGDRAIKVSLIILGVVILAFAGTAFFSGVYQALVVDR